jgi:hypothetical protein
MRLRPDQQVNRSTNQPIGCCCSSVVEHFLGKEEVVSSILINSSTKAVDVVRISELSGRAWRTARRLLAVGQQLFYIMELGRE